ncbi:LytTR family transcriptional regulator [Neolewinella aurantiaca]|uniref:LytTR family transcriptional regulator n=1 Tax=Neolewinella aurantiaca TaxID=2602767 RepID=A0A5C7G1C6_9BACT|nr:LytTR family DNA-binding domain-containing protein [Neolewinella aurantiaca]TXF91662.1 LytTR family transcriptional regulator [Neolewinella aurantiaca]
MFSILRQPYPPPVVSAAKALLVSVGLGAFVALFLIVFKPFGTDRAPIPNLNLFLGGYGLVIALVTFFPTFFFPRIWPKLYTDERWTVGWQLVFTFFTVALGITASYFYLMLTGGEYHLRDYLYFFRNGLLVSSFPIVIITLLDYIRKLRKYEGGARSANMAERPAVPPAREIVTLSDDRDRPEISLEAGRIWCLHSDGNYVEVWSRNDSGAYERTLIRNTLAKLSKQLPSGAFVTCHRSWVVNPALVESVTGNAQGYRLHLTDAPVVAVARGRSELVLARLKVGA